MCDYCSWIKEILIKVSPEIKVTEKKKSIERVVVDPIIIVHGGAGRIPRDARKFMLEEVKEAAIRAYNDLLKGRCSVDAVEHAICHMENKKFFNCAYGGSLDANNEVVMDAAIMDNFRAGCVGAVRNIEHPITLAKKILQETKDMLIVEEGAQRLALKMGIPIVPSNQLIADESQDLDPKILLEKEKDNSEIENNQKLSTSVVEESVITNQERGEKDIISDILSFISVETSAIEVDSLQIGAVGAVAYDRKKRFASGTSTAGEQGKLNGIVSATGTVIGCGIYVDQNGTASVSGCDKAIYNYAPARKIVRKLRKQYTTSKVIGEILENFEKDTGVSDIGAIALTTGGIPLVSFKCMHFPWAYCDKGYVYYGCTKNEKFSEQIAVLERPLDCMCEDSNDAEHITLNNTN